MQQSIPQGFSVRMRPLVNCGLNREGSNHSEKVPTDDIFEGTAYKLHPFPFLYRLCTDHLT